MCNRPQNAIWLERIHRQNKYMTLLFIIVFRNKELEECANIISPDIMFVYTYLYLLIKVLT